MKHTISMIVENKFGVLARVAGMFSGRGFNIDTLNVAPTNEPGLSRITVTLNGSSDQLDHAVKQVNRLVNVIAVHDFKNSEYVERELLLIKIECDAAARSQVMQICDIFRAKIVDVNPNSLVIEMTGGTSKNQAFMNMLQPFHILELARTGNLAMVRDVPHGT